MESIIKSDGYENEQCNEGIERLTRYQHGIPIVKQYKTIIRNKKYTLYCLYSGLALWNNCAHFAKSIKFGMGIIDHIKFHFDVGANCGCSLVLK